MRQPDHRHWCQLKRFRRFFRTLSKHRYLRILGSIADGSDIFGI